MRKACCLLLACSYTVSAPRFAPLIPTQGVPNKVQHTQPAITRPIPHTPPIHKKDPSPHSFTLTHKKAYALLDYLACAYASIRSYRYYKTLCQPAGTITPALHARLLSYVISDTNPLIFYSKLSLGITGIVIETLLLKTIVKLIFATLAYDGADLVEYGMSKGKKIVKEIL